MGIKGKAWLLKICIMLLMLINASLAGQTPPFSFKHFSSKEGIIDLPIHTIVRDQKHFLWLGTPQGLYIYDGHQAKKYDKDPVLANTHISCLMKDAQQNIWIGSFSRGLFRIDPVHDRVTHFEYSPSDTNSISANRIHSIMQDREGSIYIALEKEGFDIYDPISNNFMNYKVTDYLPVENPNRNNTVLCMEEDDFAEGLIWMGTLDGLLRFDKVKNEMSHFLCKKSNCSNPTELNSRENTIKTIYAEKDLLYLGTWGGGLCAFEKERNTWTSYKLESPFPASGMRNDVTSILAKSKNELWVLAYRQELGIFNTKNNTFSFHGYKDIRTMYQDESANIWMGTLSKGLLAYFPKMGVFNKVSLPFNFTKMVLQPSGEVVYAGVNGQAKLIEIQLRDNSYQSLAFNPFFDKDINFLQDLQFDNNGELFLLGLTGVYHFDPLEKNISKVFSPFNLPENKDRITSATSFLVDSKQNIWYATKFSGLYRFDLETKKLTHYKPEENKGHTAWVSHLSEDKSGKIWYGSGKGYGYYDYEKDQFTGFQNSLYSSSPDSLPFGAITSVVEDKIGNLWIGDLYKGLAYKTETLDSSIFTFTTESAPLINDAVFEIACDRSDLIWFRTREGLSSYDKEKDCFVHFGRDFGLPGINSISVFDSNTIYLSANGGYYRFNPKNLSCLNKLPEVQLRSFKVFDKSYVSGRNIEYLDTVFLDYRENFFTIDFTAVDFSHPHLITYKYMLEGLHEKWIDAGKRGSAGFTNLKGGNYKLRIKAAYSEQLFGKERILHIKIKPPFWEKIWFWLFIGIVTLGLLWFAYARRIRTIRKNAALKATFEKKISQAQLAALQTQMNPHFLFNSLNSIKLLVLEMDMDNASLYLTKFSRLIRQILNSSKQAFIPLDDEIKALRLYIEMESLRFSHEFSYQILVDEKVLLSSWQVPPMIIQVFVENAIKHGLRPKENDKKLTLQFNQQDLSLKCIVLDNGIGRKAAAEYQKRKVIEKKSMGIENTFERLAHLQQIHGVEVKITILDLFEKEEPSGTEVTILFSPSNLFKTD